MNADIVSLVRGLRARGVQLAARDGQLKITAPKGALAPEAVQRLRESKAEVLAVIERLDAEESAAALRPATSAERDAALATHGQRAMWLLAQQGAADAYHVAAALRLEGTLDADSLEVALSAVLARHVSLRTRLVEREGQLRQVVDGVPGTLARLDVPFSGDAQAQARALLADFARRPFDLAAEAPARFALARLRPCDHVLLVSIHHAAIDGQGLSVLLAELARDHARLLAGEVPADAPPALDLVDIAAWQQRREDTLATQAALAHWQSRLGALEDPARLGAPDADPSDRRAGVHVAALPETLGAALRRLSAASGITPYHWLLAAFRLALAKVAGSREVSLLVPVANRDEVELVDTVGLLANTLPSPGRIEAEATFASLARQEAQATREGLVHQAVPFEHVARHCRAQGIVLPAQAMFSLQTVSEDDLALPGLRIGVLRHVPAQAKFDLTLTVEQRGDAFTAVLEFRHAVFDAEHMVAFAQAWIGVLEQAVAAPEGRLSQVALAPSGAAAAARCVDLPTPIEQVAAQVARTPEAVALRHGDRQVTYREAWRRVGVAARALADAGVRPGDHVALLLPPGPQLVVGLLAALAVGAAYVPLDPALPADRLRQMLEDARPRVVFAPASAPRVGQARWLSLDELPDAADDAPPLVPQLSGAEAPAYLIFTSGSTGRPKGARVHQRGLAQLLQWYRDTCVDASTRVLVVSNPSFDLTQKNLLAPLTCGASVAWPVAERFEPEAIVEALAAHGATLVNCTPTAFQALLVSTEADGYAALASLRTVVLGGEPVALEPLRRWQRARGADAPAVRIINSYGPTECSDVVAWEALPDDLETATAPVAIGRAVPGCLLDVLDFDDQPLPVGAVGELCIDGDCVGLGYFGRDDLTRQAFMPGGAGISGTRYRSGDFVQRGTDGRLHYLGRRDQQVKFNGHRIELAEVEAALLAHAGLAQVAVAQRRDERGNAALVAYVVTRDGAPVDEDDLRRTAARRLAAWQVPSRYVGLAEMPLTRSGKIDRNALPAGFPASRQAEPVAARALSADEQALAELWQELLGCARLPGPGDDFFALGGHSLLAIQMVAHARRRLGRAWTVQQVFEMPTLAALAAGGRTAPDGPAPLVPADRGLPLPLSFAQQRLWFLDRFEGAGKAYHICGGVHLAGELDVPALERALRTIVVRHEVLRTRFVAGTTPAVTQEVIAPEQARFALRRVDLRADGTDATARQAALQRHGAAEAAEPFDLAAGTPLRASLLAFGARDHVLLVTMHHIVSDGWSVAVLVRELGALYDAFLHGRPDPLPPLALQYADFAAWQRRHLDDQHLGAHLDYWRLALAGAPVLLALPTDRPRPAVQSYAGATLPVRIPAAVADALRELSRASGATLFMTLMTGWAALLSRLSGQDDVVVGTPLVNRDHAELDGLIGLFVDTLAVRVDLAGGVDAAGAIAQTKDRVLQAIAHGAAPFDRVVDAVRPPRSLAHAPVFQALFAWQNVPSATLCLPGLDLRMLDVAQPSAQFDVSLSLAEADGGGIEGVLEYATDLFDATTIARWAGHLVCLLEAMAARPGDALRAMPLLDDAGRAALVEGFNPPTTPAAGGRGVHELFASRAAMQPAAVAIRHAGGEVTYGELDARSDALASRLRARGAGAGAAVVLCLERSPALVVAMLAVLKVGAAYVPVDPAYPAERIALVLDDALPALVLSHRALAERLPAHAPRTVWLDAAGLATGESSAAVGPQPDAGAAASPLAYVIYTSGSTGRPKGVMVGHASLANHALAMVDAFALVPGDRVLQFAAPAFDVLGEEVWPTLAAGATLVLRPAAVADEPVEFAGWVRRERLTVLNLPAAYWHALGALATTDDTVFGDVRLVVVGSEAVRVDAALAWQRRFGARITLLNAYGPTEATITATLLRVPADADALRAGAAGQHLAIGRPIANARLYILDAQGQPVPPGVAGEIHLGGAILAAGYLRRNDLTRAAFVPDPFVGGDARMYRTGDLGRWRADGVVEILGRQDAQVKIRGFRIELGEIEAALLACAGVAEAVVIARAAAGMEQRLVAYVVPRGKALEPAALRRRLQEALPEYMVPSAVVLLESLPLNTNGKLDRATLPEPDAQSLAAADYAPPDGTVESALAQIWQQVLGVPRVGRDDDFFALGGHSLLAIELVRAVRERLRRPLAVDRVFTHSTLRRQAAALADAPDDAPARVLPSLPESEVVPLTPIQRSQWFHFRLEGPSAAYNMASAYRLQGEVDDVAMEAALRDVVERHWILRSRVVQRGVAEPPMLAVGPAEDVPVRLAQCSADAAPARIAAFLGAPFDLASDAMARFELLSVQTRGFVLLANIHHMACDGLSLRILLRDLAQAYTARRAGRAAWTAPAPLQFAQLAAWRAAQVVRGDDARRQALAELVQSLADAPPESTLPVDTPRAAAAGRAAGRVEFELSGAALAAVERLAAARRTTAFNVLLAGWLWTMARLRRQDDLVVGVPIACRDHPGDDEVIGPLLNTLTVRIDCARADTFAALVDQTSAALAFARQRRDISFEELVDAISPPRSLNLAPLFQVQFVMDPDGDDAFELDDIQATPLGHGESGVAVSAKADINLHVVARGASLGGYVDFRQPLHREASVRAAVRAWQGLLERATTSADAPLRGLGLLAPADLRQLDQIVGRIDPTMPLASTMHGLFERQAARTPHALAVAGDGEPGLSYAALDARANQFAHRLVEAGVRPREAVAVFQGRGVARVVTLLGVLKAGAAYLPIDPDWPVSRRDLVLGQAGTRFAVIDEALRGEFSDASTTLVAPPRELDPAGPTGAPDVDVTAHDPGYLMFTSGSTGVPKGVLIRHGGVAHDLVFLIRKLGLGEGDRVLQLTSFSFDPSVRDLFATLGAGACVVTIADEAARHPARIVERLVGAGVTHVLSMVPTMLRALLAQLRGEPLASALRVLMLNGERLRGDDCAQARRVFGAGLRLVNQYGPTEATMTSATHEVGEGDFDALTVPLGVPNANTALHVMDADGQPLPQGGIGEIWITGPGLADGYANMPEQSAAVFVAARLAHRPAPQRFYRTGDLGRWRSDGVLEFHGRVDFQVKLRGHRIELGEIDACLGQQPGIGHCATTLHEDATGRQWLCAFYTASGPEVDVALLKRAMGARLPAAMVPALFIEQSALPLTSSGKVDRRRLPEVAPFLARLEQGDERSYDDVEREVARVWMDLLRLETLPSRDANFFELGANSLLMVQARDRLAERFGASLGVVDLFEHASIAALAQRLRGEPVLAAEPAAPSAEAVAGRRAHLQRRAALHARTPHKS